MFSCSQEFGFSKGLELIEGEVIKFLPNISDKIPHVSWNKLSFTKTELFKKIDDDDYFYFVHSFIYILKNDLEMLPTINYGSINFVHQ